MRRSKQPTRGKECVRILVVDDHPLVRKCLGEVLCQEPDLTVCGEAEDRQTALESIPTTRPDLVLVDLSLKNSDGLELVKDLHSGWPRLKILVLSMHDENVYAERVLRAGALGYIRKQEATRHVIDAVRRVLTGHIYLHPDSATEVLGRLIVHPSSGSHPADLLGDRELQVFELTGQGFNTREIARRLRISVKTVETYRSRIREKLRLKTPGELLQQAIAWTHR